MVGLFFWRLLQTTNQSVRQTICAFYLHAPSEMRLSLYSTQAFFIFPVIWILNRRNTYLWWPLFFKVTNLLMPWCLAYKKKISFGFPPACEKYNISPVEFLKSPKLVHNYEGTRLLGSVTSLHNILMNNINNQSNRSYLINLKSNFLKIGFAAVAIGW